MNQKQVKEVQELVIGQCNGLRALINNTCEEYETKQVALNFLKTSIAKAHIDPRKQNIKQARAFFLSFNKTLNKIEKMCKDNAKKMNAKSVPLTVFNLFLDYTQKNMIESIYEEHNV